MDSLDFVPYDTAKKLKAEGFDWTCQRFHTEKIPGTEKEGFDDEECMPVTIWDIERTPIPTLWHAQKWLREKKKMHCQVILNGVRSMYFWQVRELVGNGKYANSTHQYDVYEDAMIDCIDAALELITNKTE